MGSRRDSEGIDTPSRNLPGGMNLSVPANIRTELIPNACRALPLRILLLVTANILKKKTSKLQPKEKILTQYKCWISSTPL